MNEIELRLSFERSYLGKAVKVNWKSSIEWKLIRCVMKVKLKKKVTLFEM